VNTAVIFAMTNRNFNKEKTFLNKAIKTVVKFQTRIGLHELFKQPQVGLLKDRNRISAHGIASYLD